MSPLKNTDGIDTIITTGYTMSITKEEVRHVGASVWDLKVFSERLLDASSAEQTAFLEKTLGLYLSNIGMQALFLVRELCLLASLEK